jgi:salicylate hydroxylase
MTLDVVVVGGGIGGLTTALELLAAGFRVTVLEQASALRPIGAGIQIAPNASRQFARLGLLDQLLAVAVEPEAILVRTARRGGVLHTTPLAAAARERSGAPYLHVHRADLLDLLVAAVPEGVLRLGARVVGVDDGPDGVRVQLEGGEEVAADVLVGADGIHSTVRAHLHGPDAARFSGMVCWRGLVPRERLAGVDLPRVCEAYYGPGRSVVSYWVSAGAHYNFVGIVPAGDTWSSEDWTAEGDPADLRADFAGFAPPVRAVAAEIERPLRWAIYDRDPLPWWSAGRVTLLGDAAHPMLPYLAQGACQAIEDAGVLARCLARADGGAVAEALACYEAARRPRTTQVQAQARRQERTFHLSGWRDVWRRDHDLRAASRRDPGSTASGWLYGYDAGAVDLDAPTFVGPPAG